MGADARASAKSRSTLLESVGERSCVELPLHGPEEDELLNISTQK